MTELEAIVSVSDSHLHRGHAFSFSRLVSPEVCCLLRPLDPRGRKEGRVPAWHPRSAVRGTRKKLHSGIQVRPNARPSLRSGLTAYAVISPGSEALLPPSPCELAMQLSRLGLPHLRSA
jgi:hypothetical protein